MQLSRVVNHTLFKAIIGMKLPTDCQHLTDRSPTVNRQSVDCGQQMSCRKLSFQKNLNKSVGQLSVRCWSTVGQLSADRLPTVGQLSVRGAVLHNYREVCRFKECQAGIAFCPGRGKGRGATFSRRVV